MNDYQIAEDTGWSRAEIEDMSLAEERAVLQYRRIKAAIAREGREKMKR